MKHHRPSRLLPVGLPHPVAARRPGRGGERLPFDPPPRDASALPDREGSCALSHRVGSWTLPLVVLAAALAGPVGLPAQSPGAPAAGDEPSPPANANLLPPGDEPGGPPSFGPGGDFMMGGPGGPGGMMGQDRELVKQFDQDGDKRLNTGERKAAREFLERDRAENPGRRGPGGGGGRRGGFPGFPGQATDSTPPEPGVKLTPADVASYPGQPLYDPLILRTLFLQFESADWEKELADFNNTDVEVPATLTVDGKAYRDVGVHFRGMSSYMMVPEGRKRSLNLSLDFVDPDQDLGGYRTLNLLNSHEDPTFMHTVLALDIAREFFPAPKANFVRVVINGESWGLYVNAQQFNKDFVEEWFDTKKGARWKVTGSPMGRGGMNYLGDDVEAYRGVYNIKSKDDPESWAALIALCKTLDATPADQLEKALEPMLDVDGALRFLAWDNALANGDGFWVRASDYDLYRDKDGRFHLIPHDANETFSSGGGPGGPRGPGGPGGFGPGMFIAPQLMEQGDKDGDEKLTREEFVALAGDWFDEMDSGQSGKLTQEQFVTGLSASLPAPDGPGGFGRPGGGPGGFGPAMFLGPGLFGVLDTDQDGSLTRAEIAGRFTVWFGEWDTEKSGSLDQGALSQGLTEALPRPQFGGPGRGFGGPGGRGGRGGAEGPGGAPGAGGRRGPGGPGFMGPGGMGGGGVELDPLIAANDDSKPLLSKLLAVPELRVRYLAYVRDIAERWLDWNTLGPRVQAYRALIETEVKADTRKLESFEDFERGVANEPAAGTAAEGARGGGLRSFADQRRAYLLKATTP